MSYDETRRSICPFLALALYWPAGIATPEKMRIASDLPMRIWKTADGCRLLDQPHLSRLGHLRGNREDRRARLYRHDFSGDGTGIPASWRGSPDEAAGAVSCLPIRSPRNFLNIVDYLIPELQRRGRFKSRYQGKTRRENLVPR